MTAAAQITIAHDATSFRAWTESAKPGEVCEYARSEKNPRVPMLDKTKSEAAQIAWGLSTAILRRTQDGQGPRHEPPGRGVLDLVQRKNGAHDFSYLAIKRHKRWIAP